MEDLEYEVHRRGQRLRPPAQRLTEEFVSSFGPQFRLVALGRL
ncbi:MAG: hypothetical protein U5K30_01855 [Acidimicrobiales bacterium]|nr:hypothetical protein [Acidimicrobiales bacterium]